jgi:hypothetical protein
MLMICQSGVASGYPNGFRVTSGSGRPAVRRTLDLLRMRLGAVTIYPLAPRRVNPANVMIDFSSRFSHRSGLGGGLRRPRAMPVIREEDYQNQCLHFRDEKSSSMPWPHRYY